MRILCLLLALCALSACASLSEDQCRSGSWDEIGFADGAQGRGADFVATHAKACAPHGIEPDLAAWNAGRERGLQVYCTPDNAYEVGRRGRRIADVCSPAQVQAMWPAWRHGRRYWTIANEIQALQNDRRALRADLVALADEEGRNRLRSSIYSRIRFIDLDLLRLHGLLHRYDDWPP